MLCFNPALQAQTAGAVAPEVTQFEPIDTTDLVNLSSGDFTYTLPAVSIPNAPGGSFPLGLSYQSGILYSQEASWVGLGWNLTPGQITRAVRGIPDDYAYGAMSNQAAGDTTYSYGVSLSYSLKSGNSFSAGISFDNHGGYGGSVGYSMRDPEIDSRGGRFSAGVNASWSNRGGLDVSASGSYSVQGLGSIGTSLSSAGGLSASAGLANGTSYSTSSGLGSPRIGGSGEYRNKSYSFSAGYSSSATNMGFNGANRSVLSSSYFLSIPIPGSSYSIDLNFSKRRMFFENYNYGIGLIHMGEGIEQFRPLESSSTILLEVEDDPSTSVNEATGSANTRHPLVAPDNFQDYYRAYYANQKLIHRGPDAQLQTQVEGSNLPGSVARNVEVVPQFDFYTSDFTSRLASHIVDGEKDNFSDFDSDYAALSLDSFTVAAQGLHGSAKVATGNRSFGRPSSSLRVQESVVSDQVYTFRPYRQLLSILAQNDHWDSKGSTSFDNYLAEIQALLYSSEPFDTKVIPFPRLAQDPLDGEPDPDFDGTFNFSSHYRNLWNQSAPENNMVFLDDPGVDSENKLFRNWADLRNSKGLTEGNIKSVSKRINYELNKDGGIERIEVVKEDGVRYVFGRTASPIGVGHGSGEAPNNQFSETVSTRTGDYETFTDELKSTKSTMKDPYAYAWYLAGVYSPDYVDRGVEGPDEADFGSYVSFTYQTVSPNYHWASPSVRNHFDYYRNPDAALTWNPELISEQFDFLGHTNNKDPLNWQRQFGQKEIIVPLMAETKTHVAYFDVDHEEPRLDMLPGPEIEWNIVNSTAELSSDPQKHTIYDVKKGNLKFVHAEAYEPEQIYTELCALFPGLTPARNWDKDLVMLPMGMANRLNLHPGDVVPQNVVAELDTLKRTAVTGDGNIDCRPLIDLALEPVRAKVSLVYLGTIGKTGHEMYLVSRMDPGFLTACEIGSCTGQYQVYLEAKVQALRFEVSNRVAKLKSIGVYKKEDFYAAAKAISIPASSVLSGISCPPGSQSALTCTPESGDNALQAGLLNECEFYRNIPEGPNGAVTLVPGETFRWYGCSTSGQTPSPPYELEIATHNYDVQTNAWAVSNVKHDLLDLGFSKNAQKELLEKYEVKVVFDTDYTLAKGSPNSVAPNEARLTLKGVRFFTTHQTKELNEGNLETVYRQVQGSNVYQFDYYAEAGTTNISGSENGNFPVSGISYRKHYHRDPWGNISIPHTSGNTRSSISQIAVSADQFAQEFPTGNPDSPWAVNNIPIQAAWNLARIQTPLGADLLIEYERDSYTWVQDLPAVVTQGMSGFGEPLMSSPNFNNFDTDHETEVANFATSGAIHNTFNNTEEMHELLYGDCTGAGSSKSLLTEAELKTQLLSLDLSLDTSNHFWVAGRADAERLIERVDHSYVLVRIKPVDDSHAPVRFTLPIIKESSTWNFLEHPALETFIDWIWSYEYISARENKNLLIPCLTPLPHESYLESMLVFGIPNEGGSVAEHIPQNYADASGTTWSGTTGGDGAYSSIPYLYESRKLIGEIGGGIRTKALELRPGLGNWTEAAYRTAYDYSDSEFYASNTDVQGQTSSGSVAGVSSGVIFADPPHKSISNNKFFEDRRIVRSEMNPYFNMPGPEVRYGEVTVSTLVYDQASEGSNTADFDPSLRSLVQKKKYRFHTAKDQQVLHPFVDHDAQNLQLSTLLTGSITQNDADLTFEEETSRPRFESGVRIGDRNSNGSAIFFTYNVLNGPIPTDDPDHGYKWKMRTIEKAYHFQQHAGYKLVNNTGLTGMLKQQQSFDMNDQILSSVDYQYRARFDPSQRNGDLYTSKGTPTLEFSLGTDDTTLNVSNDFGLHGVHIEQVLMPLLSKTLADNRSGTEVDTYQIKMLAIDEIQNAFEVHQTTTKYFDYDRDTNPSAEEFAPAVVESYEEIIANDKYTGQPALTMTKQYRYGLVGDSPVIEDQLLFKMVAPAHSLFSSSTNDMKSLNMLTQPGWSASFVTVDNNFYTNLNTALAQEGDTLLDLFDTSDTSQTKLTSADFFYWSQPKADTWSQAWQNIATFNYIPFDLNAAGSGWRQLPTENIGKNKYSWEFDVSRASGDWIGGVLNTEYNEHLIVTEHKDRTGNFSSMKMVHDGRFPLASFSNAEQDQTFHESFEEGFPAASELNAGLVVNENWRDDFPFAQRTSYMNNFDTVYLGTQGFDLKAAPYTVTLELDPLSNPPVENEPTTRRERYWVRFYVRPDNCQDAFTVTAGTSTTTVEKFEIVRRKHYQEDGTTLLDPLAAENYQLVPVDNGWWLFSRQVQLGASETLTVVSGSSCSEIYLDEVSVYPAADRSLTNNHDPRKADAAVSLFSYHPHHRKVIGITGNNGRTVRFEFNRKGELLRTFDIDGVPRTENYRIPVGRPMVEPYVPPNQP
jgi:hypothetical protein